MKFNTKNIVRISIAAFGGILVIALLYFLLSFILYSNIAIETKRQLFPEIPDSVRQIADQYIVEKVGHDYFQENFVFSKKRSEKITLHDDITYRVQYDFLPLQKYMNPKEYYRYIIEVEVVNGVPREPNYGNKIPSCVQDNSLCQFNLTKEGFDSLKLQYGFQEDLKPLEPPYLRMYTCPRGSLSLIDYRTNEILPGRAENTFFTPCTTFTP